MSDLNKTDGLIDINEVVSKKFGKKLPAFLIKLLAKFIHQDYLNSVISSWDRKEDFCTHAVREFNMTVDVEGLENVPSDGTLYTFASNHPLGGADGIALASMITRNFGQVGMLANDFLLFLKPIAEMAVPVNKTGGQVRNLPALVDSVFNSDRQMLIFPAGMCSRKIDGKVQDLAWTKTFITKSISSKRTIVPVHFYGRNSRRFYAIAHLRKLLGMKFNLEMMFLPDELYKARNSHFTVKIGKPIPYTHFDKSRTPVQWAAWVRDKVYEL